VTLCGASTATPSPEFNRHPPAVTLVLVSLGSLKLHILILSSLAMCYRSCQDSLSTFLH
jgi:hypothetical protein